MQPRDVFALATLSNRLIENSTPAADQIVRSQLARDLGLKIDLGIYSGTGVSGQPIGIFNADGANAVTGFGSASADTALNKLYDMEYELMADDAQTVGEWVFALHPSIFQKLRKRADAATQPTQRRSIDGEYAGQPKDLIGYRYVLSTQLPTDSFVLAAHAACVLGQWGTMVIASSREGTNFTKRQTQILVGMTVDVGHREPKAYCVATSVS
jgi:HK97 family phage major capsid protein